MLTDLAHDVLNRIGYPASLPQELAGAKIIETHISVVLIGSNYVLKLKKSVAFPFVDHTVFSQRWQSAYNEVQLNRRLSDKIYLGLIPIFNSSSKLSLKDCIDIENNSEAPDSAIEVAVLMRTISQKDLFANLLEQNAVSIPQHIEPLAKRIADFHKKQRRSRQSASSPDAYFNELATLARDNISILQEHSIDYLTTSQQPLLQQVSQFTEQFLSLNSQLLKQRQLNGFIVDGHGDLRAEHVCFADNKVQIIDCIEFSDAIRTVDVLNDIAFLRMDLDFSKQTLFANSFVTSYAAHLAAGEIDQELLNFYSSYRAMVRAKVTLLHLKQLRDIQAANEARRKIDCYLSLATRYSWNITSPCLIAIGGFMGIGKSTRAEWIKGNIYGQLLSSDVIRKELFGTDVSDKTLDFGQGKYSEDANKKTYRELFDRAAKELDKGNPVIIDSSFVKHNHREEVFNIARRHGVPFVFIWCELDEAQQLQRLEKRSAKATSISDGRVALAGQQRASFEAFSSSEEQHILRINTQQLPDTCLMATVCRKL